MSRWENQENDRVIIRVTDDARGIAGGCAEDSYGREMTEDKTASNIASVAADFNTATLRQQPLTSRRDL